VNNVRVVHCSYILMHILGTVLIDLTRAEHKWPCVLGYDSSDGSPDVVQGDQTLA